MLLCIFEDYGTEYLRPLTLTRASYMLRAGRRTLLETTRDHFPATGTVLHSRSALAGVTGEETGLPVNRIPDGVDVLFVNGRLVDPEGTVAADIIASAKGGTALAFVTGEDLVAAWIPAGSAGLSVDSDAVTAADVPAGASRISIDCVLVNRLWDLFDHIGASVAADFGELSKGYNIFERPDTKVSEHAILIAGEHIFVAPGAEVRAGAVLDASAGPVIIDKEATIFEHTVIRGPAVIGEHSLVKAGGNVDSSVIGPWCKVAGEIKGSIIQGFSNKAHPGYLGDSVLGSWCNLGADTNTSNLRNDYGAVSLYNETEGAMESSGRVFAGLFMGDHSKCGIDTMFNTGSVIGVCCNLYGAGYQPRYVPSFMWGSPDDRYVDYRFEKAIRVARTVMGRRERSLSATTEELLQRVYAESVRHREDGPRK
ncbi:MAG: hypothetical protein KJO98_06325 [Rhodothermia bacterium]|nr:hypothetical protein [Rhodothermia bacterium]